jgi:hypothetical protein
MKSIFITVFMFFIAHSHASIEFDGKREVPSDEEIAHNRACFEELSRQGCGDPGDDHQQFRSCLHEVYPSLSGGCKKLMTTLYKRK